MSSPSLHTTTAAIRAHGAEGWQDIITAPKDHHVLVYGPYRDGSGFYQEVCKHWRDRWPVEWMDNCLAPTHWMPLPAPPIQTIPVHSEEAQ